MRLHDYLNYWSRVEPKMDFGQFKDQSISYTQAEARANRFANALIAAGLATGERVAILAKNSLDYVLFYYGASKAGIVPVPLNYRLAPPEWSYIAADAGATTLFAGKEFLAPLDSVRSEVPALTRCIALEGAHPGWQTLEAFLGDASEAAPTRYVADDADLYQMYTSGTTGRPKGAILTQRSLSSNIHQSTLNVAATRGERVLIVAPMFHAAAAIVQFNAVKGGASLVIHEEFNPAEVVRALAEDNIAMALLVPAMIQFCLAMPDVAKRRYDNLRIIGYGASPIAEPVLRRALDVFGCDFMQGYGMTETTAVVTNLLPDDHRRALQGQPHLLLSCGKPILGTEVRIVDPAGKILPTGQMGEICVRGPQLMRGYWNLPEATRETLRDGWLHTGDAGFMDEEGYVYIQDRVKDMIVSGGENVYPREIEEVLMTHASVADVAVIGVPDDQWGEVVKAVVVLKPGAAEDAESLLALCRGRLAGYKCPRSVDFIAALPRNPTGKVLKKDLRAPYWVGRKRGVN